MHDASENSNFQRADLDSFIDVFQPALRTKSHLDLFLWMQGDLQLYLPHEIFVAIWSDERLDNIEIDLISAMPKMRTAQIVGQGMVPLINSLLSHWRGIGHSPFCITRPAGFGVESDEGNLDLIENGFGSMRSAVANGIQDQRERCQVLYVAFSQNVLPSLSAAKYLRMLTPYIDFALRQVTPLPSSTSSESRPGKSDRANLELTPREVEIMKWVSAGKTNEVIGVILNISIFTVKNHLKRIFEKLEVTNRAQAVSKLRSVAPTAGQIRREELASDARFRTRTCP